MNSSGPYRPPVLPDPTGFDRFVERLRSGDRAAFGEFVGGYGQAMHRVVARCFPRGDDELVADAVQAAFAQLWLAAKSGRFPGPGIESPPQLQKYSCTVAYRRAVDIVRRHRPHEPLADGPDAQVSIDEAVADQELAERLKQAVAALPRHFRDVIQEHYFNDKPFVAIAEDTDISVDTLRSRASRGRVLLRHALRGLFGPDAEGPDGGGEPPTAPGAPDDTHPEVKP